MMLSIRARLMSAFGVVFLAILTFPQAAKAEPVTITSGFVDVTSNIRDILVFNFSGNGLSVRGNNPHAPVQQYMTPCVSSPSFCQPGDLIFPNALVYLSSEGPSFVTFNGTTVQVSWAAQDSFLQFTGPGVVIPSSAAETDQLTLTMPFDMTGTINVHDVNDPGTVIFSTTINGTGIANLFLQRPPGNPEGFLISNARYDFTQSTIPEPATMILLISGVAGIVGKRYRARLRPKGH
ncbi:MAG: PEP-CTERM sorting domain-containing protein [Pyrinomonadaceae bacterium]